MSDCKKHNWIGEMRCMNCGNLFIDGTDVNDLESEIADLRARLAAAEADAERYRALTKDIKRILAGSPPGDCWLRKSTLEQAVNATRGGSDSER